MANKVCSTCQRDDVEFYAHATRGTQNSCKICRAEYNKQHYRSNKDVYITRARLRKFSLHARNLTLLRVYNLSLEEYDKLLIDQLGLCVICHRADIEHDGLVIDHNHSNGVVRGLLCHRCNTAIGFFEDNVNFLKSAILYLCGPPGGDGIPKPV